MGGGGGGGEEFSSEFPEGKTVKASLEITDLITFLVFTCKSSTMIDCRSSIKMLPIMQKSDS